MGKLTDEKLIELLQLKLGELKEMLEKAEPKAVLMHKVDEAHGLIVSNRFYDVEAVDITKFERVTLKVSMPAFVYDNSANNETYQMAEKIAEEWCKVHYRYPEDAEIEVWNVSDKFWTRKGDRVELRIYFDHHPGA